MPIKIRLQRHGAKKKPFYFVIVADSRSPRDGKFIEKIGTYNAITIPATIVIDNDKALDWLNKGAVPSDTVKQILSYKGVLYHKHLLRGLKLGLFDEATLQTKLQAWRDNHTTLVNKKTADQKEIKRKARIPVASTKIQAEKKSVEPPKTEE